MFKRNNRHQSTKDYKKYSVFNPHSTKICPLLSSSYIKIASIDPGSVNFGFSIVKCYNNGDLIIDEIITFDSTRDDKNNSSSEITFYKNILSFLSSYQDKLEKCQFILVESQLNINIECVRISQSVIDFCLLSLKDKGNLPLIIEISPELKTTSLGGCKMKFKSMRKDWCKEFFNELLEKRNMIDIKDKLKKMRKRDDFSDCICQTLAFMEILMKEEWWQNFMNL